MLNIEIEAKLEKLKNFLGVFSKDNLPGIKVNQAHSLIANTDDSEGEGKHWVAVYIDHNGKGDYFDSYGLPPLSGEFLEYLERNAPGGFNWNRHALQCMTCVTCGEYCCAFLILRTAGLSNDDFLKLFRTNKFTNDIIIKNIFNLLE